MPSTNYCLCISLVTFTAVNGSGYVRSVAYSPAYSRVLVERFVVFTATNGCGLPVRSIVTASTDSRIRLKCLVIVTAADGREWP